MPCLFLSVVAQGINKSALVHHSSYFTPVLCTLNFVSLFFFILLTSSTLRSLVYPDLHSASHVQDFQMDLDSSLILCLPLNLSLHFFPSLSQSSCSLPADDWLHWYPATMSRTLSPIQVYESSTSLPLLAPRHPQPATLSLFLSFL